MSILTFIPMLGAIMNILRSSIHASYQLTSPPSSSQFPDKLNFKHPHYSENTGLNVPAGLEPGIGRE
jgi:hypothetical protein